MAGRTKSKVPYRNLLSALLLAAVAHSTWAQNPQPQSSPTAQPAKIIDFLSHTISWYRQLAIEQQLATEPSDLSFVQENRRVADQIVQLAFDYARTQAQLRAKERAQAIQQPSQASGQTQRLAQAVQKNEQQIQDTQTELDNTRKGLAAASAARRKLLESQVAELESEIGLLQARHDALQGMLEFATASSSGTSGMGLRAQIEELARSVPASLSHPQGTGQVESAPEPTSSSNNPVSRKETPTGIWGLSADLIRLSGKKHTIEDEISATLELSQRLKELQKPIVDNLRALIQQGDQLFAAADTASPSQLAEEKQQLDALTAQFKQTSTVMLPMSKIGILLDIYQSTLSNWREAIRDEWHNQARELLLRLTVLAVLIAIVIGLGEVWRRTTFRYVHDVRRRYQFLLLRRILLWVAIGLILIFTFASQLGSAVTFAGLITAGVAVALQNVIISVVAYFFLIGKYGIRVGDRVQIAGVTGEVVDIGLVRIHVMELGGPGNSQPTGRIVALSNSIVFQPTAGLFKQIPGTNFVWHELKLTLAAETDYHTAKERITEAVDAALADYRESMEAQRRSMEMNLSTIALPEIRAKVRLHYTASGIEAEIRFPVELDKAVETDDRLMRGVMAALSQEPRLKLVSAEMPTAAAAD